MNALRFAIGFIAGILDELGMIRARNAVLGSVKHNGRTSDGFDAVFDHLIGHVRRSADRILKGD